jgi:hypothetical protein
MNMVTKNFVAGVAKSIFTSSPKLDVFGPEEWNNMHRFRVILEANYVTLQDVKELAKAMSTDKIAVCATGGDMPLSITVDVPKPG